MKEGVGRKDEERGRRGRKEEGGWEIVERGGWGKRKEGGWRRERVERRVKNRKGRGEEEGGAPVLNTKKYRTEALRI